MRGWSYWLKCANPFSKTVTAKHLPLGLRLDGYKRDAVGRGLYRRRVHEPGLTAFLLDTFDRATDRNFVDVGANIGYFSCLFGKLAGRNGVVAAVEPEANNRYLLARNVRSNGLTNVKIFDCAVGSETGTARMGIYKPANRGRHSLVDLNGCKQIVDVPVRKLDELLCGEHVGSWALAKLDVEGYEPLVLQGAKQVLSRTEMLAMEFSPQLWNKLGSNPEYVLQDLMRHFHSVSRITATNIVPTTLDEVLSCNTIIDLIFRI